MYVMHAGIHMDGIAFWAEESVERSSNDATRRSKRGRHGGKTKAGNTKRGIEKYEFATSSSQLLKILKSAGIRLRKSSTAYALLPTRDGIPVPSTDLITSEKEEEESIVSSTRDYGTDNRTNDSNGARDEATGGAATDAGVIRRDMRMYAVEVVNMEYKDTITLLCNVMGKRTLEPGVIIGSDLAYLTDVMRLAGSLVARHQYIPSVVPTDDMIHGDVKYSAAWSPVLTGKDSERFEALMTGMPDAIRAFAHAGDDKNQAESPMYVLRQILMGMISNIIYASVAMDGHSRGISRRRSKFDSIHDAWVYYLKMARSDWLEDPYISRFVEHVHEWQRPVMTMTESPLRLCFRLDEPRSHDGKGIHGLWSVRYLLQPHDDPSLLIPADRAFEGDEKIARGINVKEFLLMSLGQASGIFSGIEDGMSVEGRKAIGGCMLDSSGAYKFLTEEAAALEQAGYVVMLPSWWTGRVDKRGIEVRATVRSPKLQASGGMLTLKTIVEFDWSVAINDKSVTKKELQKLADSKSPLVSMRGKWMVVDPDDIMQAIKFMGKKGKSSFMDIIKMKLGIGLGTGLLEGPEEKDSKGMDISVDSKNDDVRQVLKCLSMGANIDDMDPPSGFAGELRPYQQHGFSWMSFLQRLGLGGCLADDMGLGKTVQALALVQQYRESGGKKPFLLICPTSVMTNWQREASRFTHNIPVAVHHGGGRLTNAEFKKAASRVGMVVSSYGLLYRDIEFIRKVEWGGVILDEAQNIKNPHTKQSQAARTLKADARFALTGTPVENNVGDLWSIMEFLNPGFLGTQTQFRNMFFLPIQSMQDENAVRKLKQATSPFILRRLKTDRTIITDLPEKTEMKVYCKLTKEQASLYGAVLNEVIKDIEGSEGIQRKGIVLSSLAKLKQVCDHPVIFLKDNSGIATKGASGHVRSGKLTRLVEMLTEVVDAGYNALIFTQFVGMGHIIRRHLQETLGREVLFLHGGVSRKKRDEMVREFQDGGSRGPRMFVISLKAGGTGLNLTAASHVFHFDRWWNPAVEDQATDRAFRIGQKMNVQVHKMICEGTLEERIDEMIERKKEISRKVVGTGESWLTEMSNEELRNVLDLSTEDAVEEEEWDKDGSKTSKKTKGRRR